MKASLLTYISILVVALGFFMISCDSDDNTSIKNIEGHWMYLETKTEILVADPVLEKDIKEYLQKSIDTLHTSYEFKNDKTFYYYLNYANPLKGRYKMVDDKFVMLDDSRGISKVVCDDTLIYVVADIRDEISRNLNVSKDKVVKADLIQIFERGLFPN